MQLDKIHVKRQTVIRNRSVFYCIILARSVMCVSDNKLKILKLQRTMKS